MAKAKTVVDPITKLVWAHMNVANSYEFSGMVINGEEIYYSKNGNRVSQSVMQARCEKHMATTVAKIRKLITEGK